MNKNQWVTFALASLLSLPLLALADDLEYQLTVADARVAEANALLAAVQAGDDVGFTLQQAQVAQQEANNTYTTLWDIQQARTTAQTAATNADVAYQSALAYQAKVIQDALDAKNARESAELAAATLVKQTKAKDAITAAADERARVVGNTTLAPQAPFKEGDNYPLALAVNSKLERDDDGNVIYITDAETGKTQPKVIKETIDVPIDASSWYQIRADQLADNDKDREDLLAQRMLDEHAAAQGEITKDKDSMAARATALKTMTSNKIAAKLAEISVDDAHPFIQSKFYTSFLAKQNARVEGKKAELDQVLASKIANGDLDEKKIKQLEKENEAVLKEFTTKIEAENKRVASSKLSAKTVARLREKVARTPDFYN